MYGSRSTIRWWDLLPLRDKIDRLTAPVNDDYLLAFGEDGKNLMGVDCKTGFTSFDDRYCWVNANAIPSGKIYDQYATTVFISAHERAHARWTEYVKSDFNLRNDKGEDVLDSKTKKPLVDAPLHSVWNILEDERIERLLGRDFSYLHQYLQDGSKSFMTLLPKVESTDDPSQVMNWVLRNRVATRAGCPEKNPLSASNLKLLNQIQPLLDEAFSCTSSRRVVEISREIMKILKIDTWGALKQIQQLLSGMGGTRQDGDAAEEDGASEEEGQLYAAGPSKGEAEALEQEMNALGYTPGVRSNSPVPSAPYQEMLNEIMPYVSPLRQLFRTPPAKKRIDFEESGPRISIRAAMRTPRTPFKVETVPTRRGSVSMTLVVDDSGSMSGTYAHQAKLASMMAYEALPAPHRFRMVLAPTGRVVCDRSHGEMNRAFIAGYDSNSGTEYGSVMKQELAALEKEPKTAVKYLILVADGLSGTQDGTVCRAIVERALKKNVVVLGIGIALGESGKTFFGGIFGDRYIAIENAKDLPNRLQNVMQKISKSNKFLKKS